MQVTVTGGTGHSPAVLDFDAGGRNLVEAKAIASIIDSTYRTAIYYNPLHPVTHPGAYLIIPTEYATNVINARGFGAVVDENNGVASTIVGGDARGGQSVLAGDGGLTFTAAVGDVTVVAGGGANYISYAGDHAAVAAYSGIGNDTIIGGDGVTSISAGAGKNTISLGGGTSLVQSTGNDTIHLATGGTDTIEVTGAGHDHVTGSTHGHGAKLTFYNGSLASYVTVGAGSGTIYGGLGGGNFVGGTHGDNSIVAGAGDATITGGGAGDTLDGGSGKATIIASTGNETLGAGSGSVLFDLLANDTHGTTGVGVTDTIHNFTSLDLLNVGGTAAENLALSSYQVVHGNGTFTLEDGAKVVLEGYSGPLTSSDFTHQT